MPRIQLSLRITHDDAQRIVDQAKRSGLSANQVAVALLHRALAEGWTVQPGTDAAAIDGLSDG